MQTRSLQIVSRLQDLMQSSPEIEGVAVVSADGLPIASALPSSIEEDRVSAMSAAMLSLGERIAKELKRGDLDQLFIKGKDGYVFLTALGENAVLTIMARREAKLGLIFLEIQRSIDELVQLLEEYSNP